MKTACILLLCMLGAALFCTVSCNNAVGPENCCFKFYPKKIQKQRIDSYYLTDNRCAWSAVILRTKRGSKVCVNPNDDWVKEVTQFLDEKAF
uniref:C-C motif chemokine n=1 Tax=Oryzias latipes TaxID=8090 RepID=A0A3P9KX29_ORYLA